MAELPGHLPGRVSQPSFTSRPRNSVIRKRNIRVEVSFAAEDAGQRRAGEILAALPRGLKRLYVLRLMAQDVRGPGTSKVVARRLAAKLGELMMGDTLERKHEEQLSGVGPLGQGPADKPLRGHRESKKLTEAPEDAPLCGQPRGGPDRG